ncbi:hypothetical protein HZA41_01780, partial [Candidatus Peregrinibacteria bacterium]|nr:hypothetical protein [Candidatus Peregrinibacteria bacterium]
MAFPEPPTSLAEVGIMEQEVDGLRDGSDDLGLKENSDSNREVSGVADREETLALLQALTEKIESDMKDLLELGI